MARFYAMDVWPDLFGGASLVRAWARIGRPGRLRLEAHPDTASARAARDDLTARKRRRSYTPVGR